MKYILTPDNPLSDPFEFEGYVNIIVVGGFGVLLVERKVENSNFYPVENGVIELSGDCAYNGGIEEKGYGAKYRFNGTGITEDKVEIFVSRAKYAH